MQVEFRSYDSEERRHAHSDFHQLILPGHGGLEMEVGAAGGRVDGYCAALISANDDHAYRGAGDNRFAVLDLPIAEFNAPLGLDGLWDRAHRQSFFRLDDRLLHLSRFTSLELEQNGLSRLSQQSIRLFLLSLAEASDIAPQRLPEKLQHAVAYIRANHARALSSQEIASAACLSVSHLHALFKETLGSTPGQFHTQVRLERARDLIRQGGFTLAEIAQDVGFADQSAFGRAYRRHFGLTPGQELRSARALL